MKNTKCVALSLFTLAAMVVLGSCKKDDPEPKAEATTSFGKDYGSIEGTVAGQRFDGTAFSENFTYDLSGTKGFISTNASKNQFLTMYLYGPDTGNDYMFLSLKYDKKKVVSLDESSSIHFSFLKEMKNNTALSIAVQPITRPSDFHWPMKPALNDATYHFVFNAGSNGVIYNRDRNQNWIFKTVAGDSVAFGEYFGDFLYIRKPNGSTEYSSTLYGSLHFYTNGFYEYYFTDQTGANLSVTETIPADQLDVKNFSFDEGTGAMKFDFVLQVSGRGRNLGSNSTQHPLTITGKADILVYSDVSSRTRD
jgi:hypothetical protein